jgi:hypothetical protein
MAGHTPVAQDMLAAAEAERNKRDAWYGPNTPTMSVTVHLFTIRLRNSLCFCIVSKATGKSV